MAQDKKRRVAQKEATFASRYGSVKQKPSPVRKRVSVEDIFKNNGRFL